MKIILAQGNPESNYAGTRHNTGFEIINAFAAKNNSDWSLKTKFNALIAEFSKNGEKILLVKPQTYYNETGKTARALVDFYKIDTEKDLLVIHDDLALPFGTIRIRNQGSDAGNNGIKSINSHLSPNYHRVRVGINNDSHDKMDDADFVLSKFNTDEKAELNKSIIPHALTIIDEFCADIIKITSTSLTE